MSFGDQTFAEYSRFRFAEEREWSMNKRSFINVVNG